MNIEIDGIKRPLSELSVTEASAYGIIMAIAAVICICVAAPLACGSFVLGGLIFGIGAVSCALAAIWAGLRSLCFWRKKPKLHKDVRKIMGL